jgi:arylsulfatase A-like enzyme
VPLVITSPGLVPQGLRIGEAVSLVDLAVTITDLTGTDSGTLGGASLAQKWTRAAADASLPVISEFWQTGRQRSSAVVRALEVAVVWDSLQFILRSGSPSQTLNTLREPRGTQEVTNDTAKQIQRALHASLDSILRLRGPLNALSNTRDIVIR